MPLISTDICTPRLERPRSRSRIYLTASPSQRLSTWDGHEGSVQSDRPRNLSLSKKTPECFPLRTSGRSKQLVVSGAHLGPMSGPEPQALLLPAALRPIAPRPTLHDRALSIADIAALRSTDDRGARTFVARERERNRIFTVTNGGAILVPQILLDTSGEPTDVSRAVEVLAPLDLDGADSWAWLTSPSGWQSGEVPAEGFATDPDRATAAVQAYATELDVTAPPV